MKRLVVAVLLAAVASAALADGLQVKSLTLEGRPVPTLADVALRPPGQAQARPQALATGQDLSSGTELTLPRGAGAVLASRHDNTVTLYPGTAFVVGVVAPNGESHQLAGGKAEFSVKRALDFFNIGHSRFTAAVKGTVFVVEVQVEQQRIEFQVSEGAVEVEQRIRLQAQVGDDNHDDDDRDDDDEAAAKELRIVDDIVAGQSRRYALSPSQYLREFGNFADADAYFRRALDEAERSGDTLRLHRAITNLMQAYSVLQRQQAIVDLGPRCTESARASGRALAQLGCDTLVGNALQRLGRPAQAMEFHQRVADAERRRLRGGDTPLLAAALNNLALAHSALGQRQQALQLLTESLQMQERLQGPVDSQTMALRLGNLGGLQRRLGDAAQAALLHQRALDMARRLFPDGRHPLVPAQLAALAADQVVLGDLPRATQLQQQALAANQALFPGRDVPDVANNGYELAQLLRRQGRLDEARSASEAALAMRQRIAGGADLRSVGRSLYQLGAILDAQQDLEGAFARHEAALAVREQLAAGRPHPGVLGSLRALADLAGRLGRPGDARRYAQRAAAMQRQLRGA